MATTPHDAPAPEILTTHSLTAPVKAGVVIGARYQIEKILGQGGMATVYKAKDLVLKRDVALKLLNDPLADNKTAIARFEREAKAISSLRHPNIVQIYSLGHMGSKGLIVAEYLDGISLAEWIAGRQRIPEAEAIPIFCQICDALEHAHANGIVHRDLKPENILLVGPQRQVKVVDFGIAKLESVPESQQQKLTKTGSFLGTIYYLSPEQCDGRQADARSDIYSLGCVMYETLTGNPPFTANTAFAVIHQHSSEPVPVHALRESPRCAGVIRRCMEKKPSQRLQTASAVKDALLHGAPMLSTGSNVFRRAAIVLIACLLAIGIGVLLTRLPNFSETAPSRDPYPRCTAGVLVEQAGDDQRHNRNEEAAKKCRAVFNKPDSNPGDRFCAAILLWQCGNRDDMSFLINNVDEWAGAIPRMHSEDTAVNYSAVVKILYDHADWRKTAHYAELMQKAATGSRCAHLRAMASFVRADLLWRAHDMIGGDAALKSAMDSLKTCSDHFKPWAPYANTDARHLFEQKREVEAEALLSCALSHLSVSPEYTWQLSDGPCASEFARTALFYGRYHLARQFMDIAVGSGSPYAQDLELRALAYTKLGMTKAAQADLQKAQSLRTAPK